ncbi:MAG: DEAD/DEAH box helicase [Desulfobacterales bacterium]|nr:DEAD/DEAH box helicase [Desulfobacterales bacterium]
MQLRPYQEIALNVLWEQLAKDKNVLLQAIMGAGKTNVVCELIKRLLIIHPKGRILFLAHRAELITQAKERLLKVWPDSPAIGLACASVNKDVMLSDSIIIGSPQTLARRLNEIPAFHLVIVDEAHRLPSAHDKDTQYIKLIEKLRQFNPEMRLLGITATPYRLGHGYIYGTQCKKGHINLFTDLHHQVRAKELIEQGYLVPLKGKVSVKSQLIDDLKKVDRSKGDYAERELSVVMIKQIHIASVVEAYEKYATNRKYIMVFAVTIAHAEEIVQAFIKKGHDATVVHSKINLKERKNILTDFVSGKLKVLVNVAVLIEGFDAPLTDCIIHARPTLSPALFLQTVGRGLRIAEDKTDCLLIDLVGNVEEFGTDLDNICVKVPGEPTNQSSESPVKVCPECDSAVNIAFRCCPECGYEFSINETEVIVNEVPVMRDVEFNAPANAINSVIEDVNLDFYISRRGLQMLRLEVKCRDIFLPVSHYCNFEESAHPYFKEKSKVWWKQVHGWDADPPETNNEAIFMFEANRLIGEQIKLIQDGKYLKVQGW